MRTFCHNWCCRYQEKVCAWFMNYYKTWSVAIETYCLDSKSMKSKQHQSLYNHYCDYTSLRGSTHNPPCTYTILLPRHLSLTILDKSLRPSTFRNLYIFALGQDYGKYSAAPPISITFTIASCDFQAHTTLERLSRFTSTDV